MPEFSFQPSKKKSSVSGDLLEAQYQTLVDSQQLHYNPAQVSVLKQLQNLLTAVTAQEQKRPFSWLIGMAQHKSVYIFGEVGRGKSLLMELFFQACPVKKKRRVHFAVFMLEVHTFIHQYRQQHHSDPLIAYAKHLRQSTTLLCFDEFNVTDIADAMILTRLFSHLFAAGLLFVATSNYHPDDLYHNGLQRSLFLPFIHQLKQASQVIELLTREDYRVSHFNALQQRFYIGTGQKSEQFLQESFNRLTQSAKTQPVTLQVQGRAVPFTATQGDILYSSFAELCNRALGAADYVEIARLFKIVFIAAIPQLSRENRDQARRFVTLIDALYEQKVKIVCTLAVTVERLYHTDNVFEFKRTQSRLMEMQSGHYL